MIRLLYVVSHPIQYQAPLLRLIAAQAGIHLRVLFLRYPDGAMDPGFGRVVHWDVPLLEGYEHARFDPATLGRELRAADVVWLHGWQGWRMKAVLLAAKLLRRPVLMRGENWDGAMPDGPGWRGAAKRAALGTLFRLCRGFLAIGSCNARYYARLGVPPDRVFSIPYAVDNAFFARHAAAAPPDLRARLGLPDGRQVVLYAGKLSRRKHPHTLLAAWRKAFPTHEGRPVLVFVGDGEMAAELTAAAGEDVHFLGFRNQTEMPALYALADVFVLAAEREAWGLAINEAMACGTAVIASTQCGAAHDLVDGQVGAMVPPGDVEALADALRWVLPHAQDLGGQARRRIEGWDFNADLKGLQQALGDVTGQRGGSA
ncbi:Putative glycosyltransferase [Magnetospirillum sp. XM-1]|uniref:glycosyltransferase family 4 protein n=1 Tax=Magnetospirillum sp. XM-1 TaxID=1663591 RepID=UPI00073DE3C7|nr:glycosyltransferase family 4 protein [Magnetospirillum sp. XM-1]CUW38089.1 Putative glycosyltransferase [Magnetospirillum sp. XM-1]